MTVTLLVSSWRTALVKTWPRTNNATDLTILFKNTFLGSSDSLCHADVHTCMAHAVANATTRTAKTREHLREVLTQRNFEHCTHSNDTTIVLRVSSTIARAEICLGCWRHRPFLDRTHLVFDEVVSMGRQEATRPDSDEDRIRIGEFPCYSHHAGRLARLKQVPRSWPGRDSNHAEPRPTGTRSERSTH